MADWHWSDRINSTAPIANERFACAAAMWGDWLAVLRSGLTDSDGKLYFLEWTGFGFIHRQIIDDVEPVLQTAGAIGNAQGGPQCDMHGDWCVVGLPNYEALRGALMVFYNDAGTWKTKPAWLLQASDKAFNDRLGWSVSIWGDTIAGSAHFRNSSRGAAYIWVRFGEGMDSTFSEQDILVPGDIAAGDQFGKSLMLHEHTLVGGAEFHNHEAQTYPAGAAFIFDRSGGTFGTWSETIELNSPNPGWYDRFGRGAGIYGDTVVIGAPEMGSYGQAHVFKKNGTWDTDPTQTINGPAPHTRFGEHVFMHEDLLLIDSPGTDVVQTWTGEVSFYRADEETGLYSLEIPDPIVTPEESSGSDYFGICTTVWEDRVAFCAQGFDTPYSNTGAVFCLYEWSYNITSVTPEIISEEGGTEMIASGWFPINKPIEIFMGLNGDPTDKPCYGGEGYGYLPQTADDSELHFTSPPNAPGLDYKITLRYLERTFTYSGTVTVLERVWRTKQVSTKAGYPSWVGVGKRQLADEDPR